MKLLSSFYIYTIGLLLLTFVSCKQPVYTKGTTALLETPQPVDTSLVAIIPFDKSPGSPFDETYRPSTLTQNDLKKVETLLISCIARHNNDLAPAYQGNYSIDLKKRQYKRQYVAAINKNGEKEVWINGLCQTHGDGWKTSIVMVDDGGNCFFQLTINLTTEKSYGFSVNGYA